MVTDSGVYIIAEAGVNHNGDLDRALRMIDVAAEAGVSAVKFQSFRAELVVSESAPKAEYQTRTTDSKESQYDMVRKLQFGEKEHEVLINHARECGIDFLSTPYDLPSVHMLTKQFGLKVVKVPSGEITNVHYLVAVARSADRVILSTGMSTLAEVEQALGALAYGFQSARPELPFRDDFKHAYISGQRELRDRVALLHCTTEYPAPFDEVNLRVMDTLGNAFGLEVGYSDHTSGIHISLAAVARGAKLIEKHFTLDRGLPGPDHKASIEPGELEALARQSREIERALGAKVKFPTVSEMKNIGIARKSLVAAREIEAGEKFTEVNLTCKRPGTGIGAERWYEMLGSVAARHYKPDQLIDQ